MRTEKEIEGKLAYLKKQAEDLEKMHDPDNDYLIVSLEDDATLLRWVLGQVEL